MYAVENSPNPGHTGHPGILLGMILALAALLRFARLGQNSLWFDEAWVVRIVHYPWRQMLSLLRTNDAHPPLHYLLMKIWIDLAGTSEAALRFPSACASILSVGLTYALMRRVASERVSLLGAFLVTVSPFAIMVGQDARMYALLGALALASTWALAMSVDHDRPLWWVAYVVLAILLAYTHYLGFLVLLAHGVWVVGFERRHIRTWLIGMTAAALAFSPWVPAFLYQLRHGNGWPWYRNSSTVLVEVSDLFGLMAFGGSLFGLGSYFSPGAAGLAEQVAIFLPFLLVACRGGAALLTANRRGLALIALPLAVSLVAMVGLSFAKLVFYPRWFSYLLPFYAVLLAVGSVDVAGKFPWRSCVLAGVVGGLVLYSVPVLDRYYFDPRFRPYPWRAAARLVRDDVRSGDFFVFVNSASEISFSYYYPHPQPSLVLTPVEATGRPRPTFTEAQVRRLSAKYPRVWIIATPPFTPEMRARLLGAFGRAFQIESYATFPAIRVYLLEARVPGS